MSMFQMSLADLNLTEEALNDSSVRELLNDFLGSESLTSGPVEALLISIYTVMSIVAIAANSAVLYVIVKTSKLCVPTHLLLLNLMIADLLLATVCMPFTLISLIRRSWPFGWLFCKIIPLIQGTVVFASSITVAVIAIDRWFRVTSAVPVSGNTSLRTFSGRNLLVEVALIWIVSLGFAAPLAFYQAEVEVGFPGVLSYPKCIEQWPNHSFGFYSLFVLIVQLIIPMTFLLISFFRIKRHLQKNLKKLLPSGLQSSPGRLSHRKVLSFLRRGNSDDSTLTTFGEVMKPLGPSEGSDQPTEETQSDARYDDSQRKRILREMERNHRVTNTLLSVSCSFVFCWMPWNAINIIMDFRTELIAPNVAYALLASCHIIAMLSAILNPLLYGYTNTSIRNELRFRPSSPASSA